MRQFIREATSTRWSDTTEPTVADSTGAPTGAVMTARFRVFGAIWAGVSGVWPHPFKSAKEVLHKSVIADAGLSLPDPPFGFASRPIVAPRDDVRPAGPVAWMEATGRNPGWEFPDSALLHPGYEPKG